MAHAATVLLLAVSAAVAADPSPALPKIVRGAPAVTVVRPLARDSADYDFLGRLEPAAAVELRAPVSGQVAKVHVQEGADVAAGDLLIELDRAALKEELRTAEAIVKRRQAEVEQFKQRLRQPTRKLKDVDRAVLLAQRDLAQSQATIAAAAAERVRTNLEQCEVRAPVAGRVQRLAVAAGDRVIANVRSATLLGSVQPTDSVLVSFEVDETTCLRLRQETDAEGRSIKRLDGMPVAIQLSGEQRPSRHGTVEFATPRIDPQTGTASFQAILPNADGALTTALYAPDRQRELVRVRLTVGVSTPLHLVPSVAVGTDAEGNQFVLIVNARNIVEWRGVTVSGPREGLLAISDGLAADDRVVIAAERTANNAPGATLSPDDFATDLRLSRVRPGMTVAPVEVKLPDSAADATDEPATTLPSADSTDPSNDQ